MTSFIEKIHPYLLSDDKIVQDFVLLILTNSYLATEETMELALQASDREKIEDPESNRFLAHLSEYPLSEKSFVEILNRLKKQDVDFEAYAMTIANAPTEFFAKYKEELLNYFEEVAVENIAMIPDLETDEIFSLLAEQSEIIADFGYSEAQFQYGIRLADELVKRNEIEKSDVMDTVDFNMKQEQFSYLGVFYVYLAGVLKISELVPTLATLLTREEEADLSVEATNALVKIGSDEVVKEVEKYGLDPIAAFQAIVILSRIKRPSAEEALLGLLDKMDNLTYKTLIADGLCQQLSVAALPKIDAMIAEGYDTGLLELEESAYASCVINGIDHPKLGEWKAYIEGLDD